MAVKATTKAAEAVENQTNQEPVNAAQTPQEAPQKAEEQERLVYVGPTLPKGQLKQNSIFLGTRQEIEAELAPVLEKFPLVKNLLVPVSTIATAKVKSKQAGNILHKWCADMESLINASTQKEE